MKFKLTAGLASAFIGAIALTLLPFSTLGQAEEAWEDYDCPDEFAGIELTQTQLDQFERLEAEVEAEYEQVLPLSADAEAQMEALEDEFDEELYALLSPQQKQELDKLDDWADKQLMAIAPELYDEDGEEEPELTPEQEVLLDDFDQAYEQRFQGILTAEQQATIEALELQLEDDIEAVFPELSEVQEQQLDALDQQFEQQVMDILTAEQKQQFQQNLSCELPD